MIECVFTIDYEIYGNGEGSLYELVYKPAESLMKVFQKWNAPFVAFIEAAEIEIIEAEGTDSAIDMVKHQIRDFYENGFELGLHIHPQWYRAQYENERWILDHKEYNLCTLPQERIVQIVDRAIVYLQKVLDITDFTPLSFRAGNWLFKPTQPAANELARRGIKVDSSVFKGGLRHQHKLDYRRAIRNGFYWKFKDHVDVPDPQGTLLELPIFTQMVPFWKMFATRRFLLEKKASSSGQTSTKQKLNRLLDFLRFRHPLKFDFCRMTINELIHMMDTVIREDHKNPESFKPIVAIGHTKELVDLETVDSFLAYLRKKQIPISTFKNVYDKCT